MALLPVTYSGFTYLDRTSALEHGRVSPAGVDFRFIRATNVGELFRRVSHYAEFDACEMSMSTYMMMLGKGDDRLVAIPVFPSRTFRHGFVFVNPSAGITSPSDLKGRDVGISEYQMTAALWIRAFLQHDYGVAARDINWFKGGLEKPGYRERMAFEPPANVSLSTIPSDRSLLQLLETGELSALVAANLPSAYQVRAPYIRRLFDDHREVELDYFRRTGFFPIMHVVVIQRAVYEANPWVAISLLEAFCEAKRLGEARLRDLNALAVSVPWLDDTLAEAEEIFPGGNPFAYGFAANRAIVDAMAEYSHEQGFTPRKLEPEELFAAETLTHPAEAVMRPAWA